MNKIFSTLSIARKAGMLEMGFDVVKEAAETGKARLILLTCDLSENTGGKAKLLAQRCKVMMAVMDDVTMDEVEQGLGRRSGVLALTNQGFADKAVRLLGCDDKEEFDR